MTPPAVRVGCALVDGQAQPVAEVADAIVVLDQTRPTGSTPSSILDVIAADGSGAIERARAAQEIGDCPGARRDRLTDLPNGPGH
jgi:hypothetical protein